MWILILTFAVSSTSAAISTAEFDDAKACDMARDAWLSKQPKYYTGNISAFCFPKSSTIPERKQ